MSIIRDFAKRSIPKQLLEFSAPLFLAGLLQIVYNMVDMIVVGQVMGEKGLSVVFGLLLDMKYFGFWLSDALTAFTPLFIGIVFYLKGSYKNEH